MSDPRDPQEPSGGQKPLTKFKRMSTTMRLAAYFFGKGPKGSHQNPNFLAEKSKFFGGKSQKSGGMVS